MIEQHTSKAIEAPNFELGRVELSVAAILCLTRDETLRALYRHAVFPWDRTADEHNELFHFSDDGSRVSAHTSHTNRRFLVVTAANPKNETKLYFQDEAA